MKQQTKSSNITVGLDLGDRRHRFCALDERGEVVEQDSICNDRVSLRKLAGRYHGALVPNCALTMQQRLRPNPSAQLFRISVRVVAGSVAEIGLTSERSF